VASAVKRVGVARRRRPSDNRPVYPSTLKQPQLGAARYVDKTPSNYDEDHPSSLEPDGNPRDPKNLWPEMWVAMGNRPCGRAVIGIARQTPPSSEPCPNPSEGAERAATQTTQPPMVTMAVGLSVSPEGEEGTHEADHVANDDSDHGIVHHAAHSQYRLRL